MNDRIPPSQSAKHWRPFPELKNVEILQILEELRIPLSEADLLKPSPCQIQHVYELFVELYMGSRALSAWQQSSSQSRFSAIDTLEHPEIYLDAVQLMTFYRTVATLMECVGIDDFSLKDIIKPESYRTKMILSGLINFAKFREEQLSLFECHSTKVETTYTQKKKLDGQKQAAIDHLTLLKADRAKEEPFIKELEKEIFDMNLKLKDLKREQQNSTDATSKLKAIKERCDDQIVTLLTAHDLCIDLVLYRPLTNFC